MNEQHSTRAQEGISRVAKRGADFADNANNDNANNNH